MIIYLQSTCLSAFPLTLTLELGPAELGLPFASSVPAASSGVMPQVPQFSGVLGMGRKEIVVHFSRYCHITTGYTRLLCDKSSKTAIYTRII